MNNITISMTNHYTKIMLLTLTIMVIKNILVKYVFTKKGEIPHLIFVYTNLFYQYIYQ